MKKLLKTTRYAILCFVICSIISAILILIGSIGENGGIIFIIGGLSTLLTICIPLAIIISQYKIIGNCLMTLLGALWFSIFIMYVALMPLLTLECFSIKFSVIHTLLDNFPFDYYIYGTIIFFFIMLITGIIAEWLEKNDIIEEEE